MLLAIHSHMQAAKTAVTQNINRNLRSICMRYCFNITVITANKKTYLATYAGRVTKGVIKRAKVPVVVPAAR